MAINTPKIVYDIPMQVGECPLWEPKESALYWVDIPAKTVHRHHPASDKHQSWPTPTEPATLARCASGGLIVAMRDGFSKLDTNTGILTHIAAAPYDTNTTRFNDGRCDAAGRFWVGTLYEPRDKPLAEMFFLQRGKVRRAWEGGATVSNGLAFSPDSTMLYHADTTTHVIRRHTFNVANATVGAAQPFREFSTDKAHHYGGRPDGAAVDREGAYWCAMFEGGRILRLSPKGEVLQEIALPLRCPTMIAFGGDDFRTLYITSASHNRSTTELAHYPVSGCVLSIQVDVPGQAEHVYIE